MSALPIRYPEPAPHDRTSVAEAAKSAPLKSLRELALGAAGRVAQVAVEGADESRLKALGLCEGRTVQVVSAGDPLIVRVLGSRVGLSAQLAAQVQVGSC